jgi:processing peptidase subunit alpha
MAAYRGHPLGNHHYCPPDSIPRLTRDHVIAFRNKYFVASNCVLAASAVDHDEFVALAGKKFGAMPSGPDNKNTSSSPSLSPSALAVRKSSYTGSMVVEQREFREEWVKCTVGFEIGGLRSPDFVKHCVLQQLMGGGSSFSAGGPGKGMYTRLYREVLNRYGWIESAEAFVNCFNDVGLLGIDGSCRNESISSMIQVKIFFNRTKNY